MQVHVPKPPEMSPLGVLLLGSVLLSTVVITVGATPGVASTTATVTIHLQLLNNKTSGRHTQNENAHDEEMGSDDDLEDDFDTNSTERGTYLGAPCDLTCDSKLHHVFCDPVTGHCECEKNYPVQIGMSKGCGKPKKLGEQCFFMATCTATDPHSSCIQVNHNAICQCISGYHSVSYQRPTKRVFCTEDMAMLTADVPTLLGVTTGIAVLAGLICFVLHLFSRARYPRPRHYADANLAPPILFSSETGIPLAVHAARPSSSSSQHSANSMTSGYSRRPSSAPLQGSRGVLVPASRAGSRRPSLASVHSSSSVRSYSYRRYEREREQKEARQEMKMTLTRMQAAMQGELSSRAAPPTPSPKATLSTDELLPSVSELKELSMTRSPGMQDCASASSSYQGGIIGPCSSSDSY